MCVNKAKKLMVRILILSLVVINVMTTTFAFWWGDPGYEWCFKNGITPAMTQSELNKVASNEKFYDVLLKYLRYKGVRSHGQINRSFEGNVEDINPIFAGMAKTIGSYLSKTSLTPQEYKQVIAYVDHAESNIASHLSYVNRSEAKEFFLYLSLVRYRAAMLIDHTTDYRKAELAKYSNVKYKDIYLYGMQPYFGTITRKEFLVLMFTLLADKDALSQYSDQSIIDVFYQSGVLQGYEDGELWLNQRITYAEMYAFLRRFEMFDFTFSSEETATEEE